MYRYILFDLDGTLTDSKEGIINCFKYAIEKLGDPIPSEETLLSFIGPPLRLSFGSLGYDEEKIELAIKTYRERYVPIGKFENTPVEGGVELCRNLRERGYRLAIASSKPRHMCVDICEKFGFAPYLEHIVDHPRRDAAFFRGRGCSVTLCRDGELELSPLNGNVLVKCLPREKLLPTLRREKGHLQTAGLLCRPEEREELTDLLARAGLTRITRAGHMSDTFPGEGHDGEYSLRRYIRIVDIET